MDSPQKIHSPTHYAESSPKTKNIASHLGIGSHSAKVSELPAVERRNWLIHLHFVRKDFDICKSLINEQLEETFNHCEYALYIKAMILRNEGRIQDSLSLFQKCWKLNRSAENLKQIGRSLYLLGRKKAAVEAYTEALQSDTGNWTIMSKIGLCHLDLGEYDEAKKHLLQAIQIHPHAEAFEALGQIFVKKGDLAKAIETYRKATEYCPDSNKIKTTLGLLYLEVGQQQKAFEKLSSVSGTVEDNVQSRIACGSILQSHGDADEAIERYRSVVPHVPDSPFVWNNIGMCFYSKKKYVASISCLKRANYLAPCDWKIQYNLGLVHLTMQQYASAFQFLSAAHNLNPNDSDVYMLLAVALKHLEDYDTAKAAFSQAMQLGKNELVTPLNYAIFLDEIGDKSEALNVMSVYDSRLSNLKKNEKPDAEILDLADKIKKVLSGGSSSSKT
ncbi:BBS4 (predicted) [Pycnogonum litorale]